MCGLWTLPWQRVSVVSITDCSIKGRSFHYTLMSRRSCHRAGTRYNIRGIDTDGHVANFVETEQIVETGNTRCSYVQVLFSMINCKAWLLLQTNIFVCRPWEPRFHISTDLICFLAGCHKRWLEHGLFFSWVSLFDLLVFIWVYCHLVYQYHSQVLAGKTCQRRHLMSQ